MATLERSQESPLTFDDIRVRERDVGMRCRKDRFSRCDFLVGVWLTFVPQASQPNFRSSTRPALRHRNIDNNFVS